MAAMCMQGRCESIKFPDARNIVYRVELSRDSASPGLCSFTKYWNEGEPNNDWDEDCAEFRDEGWNDAPCKQEKFWICKKPAAACSME
jgi:hypothetical protein